MRLKLVLASIAVGFLSFPAQAADRLPSRPILKAHIDTLASPEFGGRSGEASEKSRAYLIKVFESLKLKPLFNGTYRQDVPGTDPKIIVGQNVGAILEGSDPKLHDEWIIIGTHFDHLGKRGEVLYPGADDNASGVAMMLEVARCLATNPNRPKRSVMILGFDLEEAGLWGSRYFAEHCPIPLDRVKLFVTADMIGRSLGGIFKRQVFLMGTEHIPAVRATVERCSVGLPIQVGTLGADALVLDRSDYGPFRTRKIPFLFFSTGENPHYHRPTDLPETIDIEKVEAISRLIYGVIQDATVKETLPPWSNNPDHPLAEALTIRDVFVGMLEHKDELKISPTQAFIMRNTLRNLERMIERKTLTPSERTGVLRVVQGILATVF